MKTPWSRWLTWVVLVASFVSLGVSWYTGAERAAYQRCQVAVNDNLIRSQQARALAAEQDRQAMDDLVANVLAASETRDPGASLAALRDYLNARADADAQRAANPIPVPPSQTCG